MYRIDGQWWISQLSASRQLQVIPTTLARRADEWGIRRHAMPGRQGLLYSLSDVEAIAAGSKPTPPRKTARLKTSRKVRA